MLYIETGIVPRAAMNQVLVNNGQPLGVRNVSEKPG